MHQQQNEDGVTHINIYSKGQTLLGQALSNWSDCRIEISIGYFKTIEGLIFYLGSFNNSLRFVSGSQAKKIGERQDRGIRLPEDVFKGFIVEAMWAKVEKDKGLKEALKYSTLPFDHYYIFGGKKIRPEKWSWQIQEWEKIRKELQE